VAGTDGERLERHLHEVAQHTAGGILLGMVWGGYRGSVDNVHLRNTYAEFRDTRNPYKVPMNFVKMANEAASMGWRLGLLAGAFTGCRAYLREKNGSIAQALQKSDNGTLRSGAALLKDEALEDFLPTGGAGTLVGALYGAMRGLRGAALGCMIGAGVSFGVGGLQASLESFVRKHESQLLAEKEASGGTLGAASEHEAGFHALKRPELLELLAHLRQREMAEVGQKFDLEKEAVKRRLKELKSA